MAVFNRLPEQSTFGFFGGVFLGACITTVIWWVVFLAALASMWGMK